MIDAEVMLKRQKDGAVLIDSLNEDERTVLQHFCSLLAESICDAGAQRGATVNEIAVNAIKNGIALGLQIVIEGGEVV